ncbi:MAG: phosphoribosylaminoimidazolesuccinocarboxamide synthase [Chloroflexota bacterium]
MKSTDVLTKTELPLPLFSRGKVRDTYELGDKLLMITTDRVSAFDVVLGSGVSNKGKVLNQLSAFWFEKTKSIITNHLIEAISDVKRLDVYTPPASRFSYPPYLAGRSMVVKRAKRISVECVVRGYLSGSAWAEYSQHGMVNGMTLPKGLRESEELPELLFTPTTKAESGHDLPITMSDITKMTGEAIASEIKEKSLAIYSFARKYALERGIIIADTKMEFGLDNDGKLILIDELLTPDSSRFWDISLYQVGQPQPSYDKQPLRDWLAGTGWNKTPPAPALPPEVVAATTKRYETAYERLTGKKLSD